MAYDSLKALIRQYIKTNGEQEITGQILQNVLVEMVNQYPSTDGYATQSWVTSQLAGYIHPTITNLANGDILIYDSVGTWVNAPYTNLLAGYATQSWVTTQLGNYLPLTGGILTGTLTVNSDIIGYNIQSDGIITAGGDVTATGFKKRGGQANQFLKADGSVDSNSYALSSSLSNYLPLSGGTLTGNLDLGGNTLEMADGDYTSSLSGSSLTFAHTAGQASIRLSTTDKFLSLTGRKILLNGVDSSTYVTSDALAGYIHPTLTNLANGDILIYDSVGTWVNAPYTNLLAGYATQSWVTSQLAGYLPLTGGTLSGDLRINATLFFGGAQDGRIFSDAYDILYIYNDTQDIEIGSVGDNYYINIIEEIQGGHKTGETTLTRTWGINTDGEADFTKISKSGGTSAQFLKADGSVDSTAYLPKQGNSFYFITDADMPETAANISTLNAAHRMTLYRNAILMPYQMDNANDGGFIRSRGTSENSAIFEIGMWDDSGAGKTIQFNYYPTTSTVNPTYSISVPKKTGTIALTSDLASYNPTTNFKTINNQSIIGTGNINIEGGGGGAYYDAEVEYLEGTGTQFIDTGIATKDATKAELQCFASTGTNNTVFGNSTTSNNNGYPASIWSESSGLRYYSVGQSVIYLGAINTNINAEFNIPTNSVNSNIYIFKSNGYYGEAGFKCYRCKLYNGTTLIRDFIPVRVGNVGYMYDKVSGELFGNSGTGDFVLGQDTGPGGGLPYLPLTGGTITGHLTVNGILTASNGDLDIWSTGNSGGRGTIFDFKQHQDVYFNSAGEYFFYAALNAPAFNNTSDLRKKTITGDVPMNLYNVANAPLFKFTWKDEKKYSGQHIGSAAQYWQTVLPELVSIGRDADMTLAMQYDVIALASAITVAKTVVNHEERIILLERENEALKKEIADLKSA